jgi:hypothetical protein
MRGWERARCKLPRTISKSEVAGLSQLSQFVGYGQEQTDLEGSFKAIPGDVLLDEHKRIE